MQKLSDLDSESITPSNAAADIGLSTDLINSIPECSGFSAGFDPYVDISLSKGSFTNKVIWGAGKFEAQLPEGYTTRRYRVLITGEKRIVLDSDKKTGSVDVPINEFPANINISVKVAYPGGQLSFDGELLLKSEDYSGRIKLIPSKIGASDNPTNLDDLLKQILQKIAIIEARLALIDTQG
jgi:hypothetical protein